MLRPGLCPSVLEGPQGKGCSTGVPSGRSAAVLRAHSLVHWQVSRQKVQQGRLLKQAAQLKAQAAKLNQPDTFASCAKLQRQAASCEREANIIRGQQVINA